MDSKVLTQLDVRAITPPRMRFASAQDFANEGDDVTGLLVHYHPTIGAQDYDRNNCGVLILQQKPDLAVKVALDKGQLATAAHDALAFAQTAVPPGMSKVVRVTYEGQHDKGYKLFSVKVGMVGNQEACARWIAGEPAETPEGLTVVQG